MKKYLLVVLVALEDLTLTVLHHMKIQLMQMEHRKENI